MTRSAAGEQFVIAVTDMLAPLGSIQWTRFFSGYALKSGDVQFAMVMKGTLYLRVDAALAGELAGMGSQPFAYETKRRRVSVGTYYSIPEDWLDDAHVLAAWAGRSIAAARASRKGASRREAAGHHSNRAHAAVSRESSGRRRADDSRSGAGKR